MIIIETFQRGASPRYRPTASVRRNQDRYLMIPSRELISPQSRSFSSLVLDQLRWHSHDCTSPPLSAAISHCSMRSSAT